MEVEAEGGPSCFGSVGLDPLRCGDRAREYGMGRMGKGGEVDEAREYIARALFLNKWMGVLGSTSVQLAKRSPGWESVLGIAPVGTEAVIGEWPRIRWCDSRTHIDVMVCFRNNTNEIPYLRVQRGMGSK